MKPKRPEVEAWAVAPSGERAVGLMVFAHKDRAVAAIRNMGIAADLVRLVPYNPAEQRVVKAAVRAFIGRPSTKKGVSLFAAVRTLLKRRAKK